MTNRDSMVITPQLAPGVNTPRERAREDRKTRAVTRKRRGLIRRLHRARAANGIRRRRRGQARRKAAGPTKAGKIAAGKSLKPGWIAVAAIAVDALTIGVQAHQRYNGVSVRLIEAQNADTVMGDLDEQATANFEVLNEAEGNLDLLRAIGRDGKVNASTMILLNQMKALALTRARGADMIQRDEHFDGPDTMIDKLMMTSNMQGLKDKADLMIRAVRAVGFGKLTGR